jgi:hypothetical protein
MRSAAADESGWRARLAAAGVRVDLVDGDVDDRELALLELSVLRAARESTLSDDDLYPVLARVWTGHRPIADWPPDAPALARRCAARLTMHGRCGFDASVCVPTSKAVDAARHAIVGDLRPTPGDLLQALTDDWFRLKNLDRPIYVECTLLAFARHVLLEPVAGACALIWCSLAAPSSSPTADEPIESDDWPSAHGFDEDHMVSAELARLGQRQQRVAHDGAEGAALLASGRATALRQHDGLTLVAESIVRTSGWPGDTSMITALANEAVLLASRRIDRVDPDMDNEILVDEIQHRLLPAPDGLIVWARDPGFATLLDPAGGARGGGARTGAEMLKAAADWLTWGLAQVAIEVMVAVRRESNPRS